MYMDDVERYKISLSFSPFVLGVVTLLKGRREKGAGKNVTHK